MDTPSLPYGTYFGDGEICQELPGSVSLLTPTLHAEDTNVVSELRKPKPYGAAVAWLHSLELGQGFFSAVTFGEIQKGVELTRREAVNASRGGYHGVFT